MNKAEPRGIGDNKPPQTPFEAAADRIELLHIEATNWLDGDAIENQGQADAVSKLLGDIRKARKEADGARKVENEPYDKGKAEVQGRYNPLLKKADTIADLCKKVLAPFLARIDAEKKAIAEQARKDADEAAAKAREAIASADKTDLAAREEAERYADDAKAAESHAKHAAKDKGAARGGDRAVTLRTKYEHEVSDYTEFARYVWQQHRADMQEFLTEYARRLVRSGSRSLPGVVIHERKETV